MRTIDWIVCLGVLAYSVWDCVRRTQNSRSLEGYFVGRRAIPWWAAGLSVMATQISAITVLGTTGQGHDGGLEFVQFYFGLPFAMVLLCAFLVPLLRQAPILTAYEYLEGRFGPGTRTLASAIFLLSRGLALGVTLSAPGVILSAITGLDVTTTIALIGLLTTVYTVFGGVTAVIWMDVKQMVVIIFGLLLVLVILLARLLPDTGVGGLLTALGAAGKLNAFETVPQSSDLLPRLGTASGGAPSFWEDKYNVWSGTIGALFLFLAYFGCDHSQAQRVLASRSVDESRKSLLVSAFAKVPMQTLVLGIGVLMYLFFALHGAPLLFDPSDQARARAPERTAAFAALEADYQRAAAQRRELALRIVAAPQTLDVDPELERGYRESVAAVDALRQRARREVRRAAAEPLDSVRDVKDTNYVFTWFILHHLPPVILGLVVAAIFAAALSSSDSVLNSLAAAVVVDFYKRWLRPAATEAQAVRVSRMVTVVGGLFATATGIALYGSESLIEQVNRLGSYFYGSLLGVFALAVLVPGAGARASFAGLLSGMAAVQLVHWTLRVEFLWYNVIGCAAVLLVGGAVVAAGLERRR